MSDIINWPMEVERLNRHNNQLRDEIERLREHVIELDEEVEHLRKTFHGPTSRSRIATIEECMDAIRVYRGITDDEKRIVLDVLSALKEQ